MNILEEGSQLRYSYLGERDTPLYMKPPSAVNVTMKISTPRGDEFFEALPLCACAAVHMVPVDSYEHRYELLAYHYSATVAFLAPVICISYHA